MRVRLRSVLLVVGGAALARTSAAAGAEGDAHARAAESFREGQAAYDRRDYSAAAAAFELAAGFEPNAVSLLDAADAWTRAHEPVRAATDCDRAQAMPLSSEQRQYAAQLFAKIGGAVATLRVAGSPTTSLTIDGGEELRAPVQRRIAPGRHVVEFRDLLTGARAHQEVDLRGGDLGTVSAPEYPGADAKGQAPKAVIVSPTTAPKEGVPVATWICFGVAAAAVGVTSVFGVLTLQSQSDFNDNPTESSKDAFYRNRATTDIALGAAAIGAVAGVVLWLTAGKSHAASVNGASVASPRGWAVAF